MLETLEELTALEFNDKIASLPEFLCKRCSKILERPIMLVKSVGNICGDCAFASDCKTASRNSALESILQNLVVSCRNVKRGCKTKLAYIDLQTHNLVCRYRDYACAVKLFKDCNWKGTFADLITHTADKHQEYAIEGCNNTFKFNIDMFDNHEIVKLLYTEDIYLVLRIKCSSTSKVMQYIVYYIQSNEDDSEILCTISQTHNSITKSISYSASSYEKNSTRHFDVEQAVRINLPEVLSNSKPTTIRLLLNNTEEPDEKFLKFLDCIVCKSLMKPPIYQCLVGHNICSFCKQQLKECPTCKAKYYDTRNFTLESIYNDIKFPCTYREFGCRKLLFVTDIEKHELLCSSKPHSCPFNECSWRCAFSEIENHLLLCHNENLVCDYYTKKQVKYSDITDTFCMIAYNKIFRISHKQDQDAKSAYWIAHIFSQTYEAKKYKYEIGLINSNNGNQTHVKSDVCQNLSVGTVFRKGIKFAYQDISLFFPKNEFTYYCKISKKS